MKKIRYSLLALLLPLTASAATYPIEVDEQTRMRVNLSAHYRFLTWLQESLTQALVGEAPE